MARDCRRGPPVSSSPVLICSPVFGIELLPAGNECSGLANLLCRLWSIRTLTEKVGDVILDNHTLLKHTLTKYG